MSAGNTHTLTDGRTGKAIPCTPTADPPVRNHRCLRHRPSQRRGTQLHYRGHSVKRRQTLHNFRIDFVSRTSSRTHGTGVPPGGGGRLGIGHNKGGQYVQRNFYHFDSRSSVTPPAIYCQRLTLTSPTCGSRRVVGGTSHLLLGAHVLHGGRQVLPKPVQYCRECPRRRPISTALPIVPSSTTPSRPHRRRLRRRDRLPSRFRL